MMNFESKLTLKWKVYLVVHRCILADFVLMIFVKGIFYLKKCPLRNKHCLYQRYISYINYIPCS